MLKELVLLLLLSISIESLYASERSYCSNSALDLPTESELVPNDIQFESFKGQAIDLDFVLSDLDLETRNKVFLLMGGFLKLQTRNLGETKDGFPVYLLQRGRFLSWVLKKYSRPRELEQDHRAYIAIKEFLESRPDVDVKMPEMLRLNQNYLFIEYIPGVVLEDLGVSQFMKSATSIPLSIQEQFPKVNFDKVVRDYAYLQDELNAYLEEYYHIDNSPFLFPEMTKVDYRKSKPMGTEDESFNVFLHPENVLLDSRDSKLTIIDPY